MSDPAAAPSATTNLDGRIAALEKATIQTNQSIQAAAGTAEAQRSWIAKKIIIVFVASVGAVFLLLLLMGIFRGDWYIVATSASEIVKSVVLPIVTLVLGYYFGQAGKQ